MFVHVAAGVWHKQCQDHVVCVKISHIYFIFNAGNPEFIGLFVMTLNSEIISFSILLV